MRATALVIGQKSVQVEVDSRFVIVLPHRLREKSSRKRVK